MSQPTLEPISQDSGTAKRPRSQRNHQMDLMRILFAAVVLLSHAAELTDGNRSREPFHLLTGTYTSFGELGVHGFFLLSGFLIVKSWFTDPHFPNFLRKRILRIVPGYAVAAILSTIVVGLLAPGIPDWFHHLGRRYAFSLLTLGQPDTPAVFTGMPYPMPNTALYTIRFEFCCYLIVGFCGLLGLFRWPWLWICGFVATFLVAYTPLYSSHGHWMLPYICFIVSPFFLGACFHLYRRFIHFHRIGAIVAMAFIVASAFRPVFLHPVLILCGAYLLFYLISIPVPGLKWMEHFPDISYGLYLYGWPVESLWIWYHRNGSPWVTFAVSLVLCVGFGWMSWHFIERPFMRLKKKPSAPIIP